MSVLVAVNILTPIFVPVIKSLGIDPVFFGVLMTIKPLHGSARRLRERAFCAGGHHQQSFEEVSRQVLPYLLPILAVVVLVHLLPFHHYFPPRLMH